MWTIGRGAGVRGPCLAELCRRARGPGAAAPPDSVCSPFPGYVRLPGATSSRALVWEERLRLFVPFTVALYYNATEFFGTSEREGTMIQRHRLRHIRAQ